MRVIKSDAVEPQERKARDQVDSSYVGAGKFNRNGDVSNGMGDSFSRRRRLAYYSLFVNWFFLWPLLILVAQRSVYHLLDRQTLIGALDQLLC